MSVPEPGIDERLELDAKSFLDRLAQDELLLLRLRDELYEGSWDNLRLDLENRLRGRPYIFKLTSRIEGDLRAVRLLDAYEQKHGVDLGRLAAETGEA